MDSPPDELIAQARDRFAQAGDAASVAQNLTCPLLNLTPGAFIIWT